MNKKAKQTIITSIIISLIAIIFLTSYFVLAQEQIGVTRNLSSSANPNEIITVTLNVGLNTSTTSYAIEEYIPNGWTIIDDGGGGTSNKSVLKWAGLSAQNTTYTYTVQAPSQVGTYTFDGIYLFEGAKKVCNTLGDTEIEVEIDLIWESKEKNISKSEIKRTYNSETYNNQDGTYTSVFYNGITFTDENGTLVNETASLKDCQFCNAPDLQIKIIEDKKFPVSISDIVDYNSTSITICPKVSLIEINKDIPLKVYTKEFNLTTSKIDLKLKHEETINLKSTTENKCSVIPFGFDKIVKWGKATTTIEYSGSGDGNVGAVGAYTWDEAHDLATGTTAVDDHATHVYAYTENENSDYYIQRVFLPFNTSALPDNAVISSATINLYNSGITLNNDNDGDDFIRIVHTSQASPTALITADYNQCGAVDNPTAQANDIDIGSLGAGYNIWTLNPTGISNISLTDWSYFGFREGHDVIDSAIATGSNRFGCHPSEYTGTSQDPYLNITYFLYPYITLVSPNDNSHHSLNNITFNCSATENYQLANISLYHNITGTWHKNQTTTITGTLNSSNWTINNIPEGSYIWNCLTFDNDSNSGWGDTNWTFSVDSTNPVVNLQAPANDTPTETATQSFNATFTDNLGLINATFYLWNSTDNINTTTTTISGVSASVNLTVTLPYADNFTWNYYACDNANNCAWNTTNWTIEYNVSDSEPPNVTIVSPTNTTYKTNSITFNITAVDDTAVDNCTYSLTGGTTNYTMSNTTTSWNATNSSMTQGSHTVTFFCNDTYDNINGTETQIFFIDSIDPEITISTPANDTYSSDTGLDIKYQYNDTNCDSVVWKNITTNLSLPCGTNITNVTWGEGKHNISIYINDTAGNNATAYVSFIIDTTNPLITITTPTNTTYTTASIDFNISSNEDLTQCILSINNWVTNYTMTKFNNTYFNYTNSSMKDGSFTAKFWCNDSANNINSTETITFFMDLSTVTTCRTLNQTNTIYTLQNNIVTTGLCFTIEQNNITLDFSGYNISGDCSMLDDGVYVDSYDDITIKNGRLDKFYRQIYVNGAYRLNLTNMTFNGSCYADTFNSMYDSSITDIKGLGGSIGLWMSGSNNTLDNCDMARYSSHAFSIAGNYNTIKNSFSRYNTGVLVGDGIYISGSYNNITNNTIESNENYAIYLPSNSDHNIFEYNDMWNCSSSGLYACIFLDNSDNCTFGNNQINLSKGHGIVIESGFTDSINNLFQNTNMININLTAVNLTDAGGLNNTFLNFTYDDESVETGSQLIRKWHYRVYVNDTNGIPMTGVSVSVYNTTNDNQYNLTTLSGYTNKSAIIEYINLGGTKTFYSNYTITALGILGHTLNHQYNTTTNELKDLFTFSAIGGGPGGGGGVGGTGHLTGGGGREINELIIELKPHYFIYNKTNVSSNLSKVVGFDGVIFEIIGKNLNEKSRILNLEIVDASPLEFKNSLNITFTSLRILQNKTLWTSGLIDASTLVEGNTTFWIKVKGINEKTNNELSATSSIDVFIKKYKGDEYFFLVSLGERIWEDNPGGGLLVLMFFGGFFIFVIWKNNFGDKVERWKEKSELKRKENRRDWEGW